MYTVTSTAIAGTINEFKRWQLWFPAAIVIIAAVSIYDVYMIIRNADVMISMEENPIGLWLLEIADGQVGVFVRVKLAGTLLVLSTLMFLWIRQVRMIFTITTCLASYQTMLMFYLTVI